MLDTTYTSLFVFISYAIKIKKIKQDIQRIRKFPEHNCYQILIKHSHLLPVTMMDIIMKYGEEDVNAVFEDMFKIEDKEQEV